MSNPKRHHFVSQFVLKNFTQPNGKLFYFNRRIPERQVGESFPDGIFFEKHLYSSIERDGTKNTKLEKAYSKLEGETGPLLGKIITQARERALPKFSPTERLQLNAFLYHHIKRSPDFVAERSTHTHDEGLSGFNSIIDRAVREERRRVKAATGREATDDELEAVRRRVTQNATVIARSKGSPEVGQAFSSRGIGVAYIDKPNKSFVIGSFPFMILRGPGAFNIPLENSEMWLPIASDVAITLFGMPFSEHLCIPSDTVVRKINEGIAVKSTTIAGRSDALVASLSNLMPPTAVVDSATKAK